MSTIKSTSPGNITLTSSNDTIVSLDNLTADVEGIGVANITVNQEETTNYNAATSTFKITVSKPDPKVIDTDGDGVVDADDLIIDNDKIWNKNQFSFDLDSWGLSYYTERGNGQLRELNANEGASGYLTPELKRSPIDWSEKITWKARTEDSWINIIDGAGKVVELNKDNSISIGDRCEFVVEENETGDDREGYIYIDYYYDNIFLETKKEEIEQNEVLIIDKLDDGTLIPQEATGEFVCSSLIDTGGYSTAAQRWDTDLGSATGSIQFYRQSYSTPDRFVVIIDGEIKLDTGFVNSAEYHNLTKTSTESKASVIVYTNNTNTAWQFELSCVNSTVQIAKEESVKAIDSAAVKQPDNPTPIPQVSTPVGSWALFYVSGGINNSSPANKSYLSKFPFMSYKYYHPDYNLNRLEWTDIRTDSEYLNNFYWSNTGIMNYSTYNTYKVWELQNWGPDNRVFKSQTTSTYSSTNANLSNGKSRTLVSQSGQTYVISITNNTGYDMTLYFPEEAHANGFQIKDSSNNNLVLTGPGNPIPKRNPYTISGSNQTSKQFTIITPTISANSYKAMRVGYDIGKGTNNEWDKPTGTTQLIEFWAYNGVLKSS